MTSLFFNSVWIMILVASGEYLIAFVTRLVDYLANTFFIAVHQAGWPEFFYQCMLFRLSAADLRSVLSP